jgi:hypothetical protein
MPNSEGDRLKIVVRVDAYYPVNDPARKADIRIEKSDKSDGPYVNIPRAVHLSRGEALELAQGLLLWLAATREDG